MISAELDTGLGCLHAHLYLLTIQLLPSSNSIRKHLTPGMLIPLLYLNFPFQPHGLLSSLCCSAAAAGLLLGPTKNNGIATGNGDDDEWGGDEKRRGFILLSDLEWLTAGRRFWCVCACERGLCCWESWAEVKQWIAEQEVCGQEVNLRDYLDSDQAAVFPPEATQRPAAASTGFILHVGTNPRSKSWNSSWSKCVLV